MCKLTKIENTLDSFTGYKIAVKKDGEYYSPAMGIKYQVGPVEIPEVQNCLCTWFSNSILDRTSRAYSSKMVGRTCVFKFLGQAKYTLTDIVCTEDMHKVVILKMTISGDLMSGKYGPDYVVGGRNILAMEEVCDEN